MEHQNQEGETFIDDTGCLVFPTVFSEDEPDTANEIEISTAETVEAIVSQLMEKQRMARQTALVKQLECGCPDANCADGKSCSHPMRRISAAKSVQELGKRSDGHAGGGGGGTAPNVLIGSRVGITLTRSLETTKSQLRLSTIY